jgi:hypothetical protein
MRRRSHRQRVRLWTWRGLVFWVWCLTTIRSVGWNFLRGLWWGWRARSRRKCWAWWRSMVGGAVLGCRRLFIFGWLRPRLCWRFIRCIWTCWEYRARWGCFHSFCYRIWICR